VATKGTRCSERSTVGGGGGGGRVESAAAKLSESYRRGSILVLYSYR